MNNVTNVWPQVATGTLHGGQDMNQVEAATPSSLAIRLAHQGRFEEAAASLLEHLLQDRVDPTALFNLGLIREYQGNWSDARSCYRQALKIRPQFVEAHHHLVRLDEPDAHYARGNFLSDKGWLSEAAASFQEALRLRPGFAEAHNNLGIALKDLGRLDEAEASCRQAVNLKPQDVNPHNNLGLALMEQGKLDEAASCFQEALRLGPDNQEVHKNYGLLLLVQGRFEEGWPELECGERGSDSSRRFTGRPRWDGSLLNGRTILLYTEHGRGDTLQLVRYAPQVKARAGHVVLECEPALAPLLATCPGIDRLASQGDSLPAYDVQLSVSSLPAVLGARLDNIPRAVPYLSADCNRVARWRRELGEAGLKIGIAWQGNPNYERDRQRSVPLARFARLADIPGVRLFSLQKGPGTDQLGQAGFPVTDLGPRLDENCGAFLDSAAVMQCLDLVITSDTAIAHLAGALAVRVWVALSFVPDWRWLLEREDSPWYPTMRLFRQSQVGKWEPVFERIAAELKVLAQSSCQKARPVRVEIAPGELLDKLSILEIKSARIADPARLQNVQAELALLTAARAEALPESPELNQLVAELRAVNELLWSVEDEIRGCEAAQDFGPRFIELARMVYRHNDRRAALKRRINDLLGARLMEEKAYAP